MLITLSGIVMPVKLVQSRNAERSMLVSLLFLPKVMLVRLVHLKKVFSPILVTPSGIVMLFRLVHRPKAPSPMLVTLSGIVMLVRLVQL